MLIGIDRNADMHQVAMVDATGVAASHTGERALPMFARAFTLWPGWREVVPRLPASGLLPDDDTLIEKILAVE